MEEKGNEVVYEERRFVRQRADGQRVVLTERTPLNAAPDHFARFVVSVRVAKTVTIQGQRGQLNHEGEYPVPGDTVLEAFSRLDATLDEARRAAEREIDRKAAELNRTKIVTATPMPANLPPLQGRNGRHLPGLRGG